MSAVGAPADLLHGVSLEQYAGVTAALGEGFPLTAILANEQIALPAWPEAEVAWKARVARDDAGGALLAQYREKRAAAEDWLARGVAPIDTDLAAWMSFLRAYGAHPAQVLEGAGLGMNDLARLQRRWARRMAEDQTLSKQAAELAKKGPGPLPALRVSRAELKPFPWSKGRAPEPVAARPRVAAPAETSMAPGKLRLYSYVAVKARLAESPGNEPRVLAELGMNDFATTDAGWQAVLRDDPELARDYQRLLGLQRAKLRGAAKQGPRPSPAPTPSPPIESAPAVSLPLPVVRRAPAKLAGTALAVGPPNKSALPFGAGAGSPAALVVPAAPVARKAPAPRADLAGTSLALDLPRVAALPFAGVSSPPAPPPPAPGPPAPAAPTGAPGGARPKLTLEQHASLSCEIAEAPDRALEALARYRVTPAEKREADLHYAERFAREPGMRTAWDAAYLTYRGWWQANRVSR